MFVAWLLVTRIDGGTIFAGTLVTALTFTGVRARSGRRARCFGVTRRSFTCIDSNTSATIRSDFVTFIAGTFVLRGSGLFTLRVGTANRRYETAVINLRTRLAITVETFLAFAGMFTRSSHGADGIG